MGLTIVDYGIIGVVLAISGGIGLYYRFTGDKQRTIQEYLLANGQMTCIPVAFSLMASFMSAITLLGVSSENYMHGTQYMLANFGYLIGTPLVARLYLPVFYNLRVTSVYEYLFLRFGPGARLLGSIAFSIQMVLYSGIALFAPALALSAVTGMDKDLGILAIGLVCTFYSTIGGMKAVLFTDVFQGLLMIAGMYCVIIKGCLDYGGPSAILSTARDGGRIEVFNLDLDPTVRHTIWSQLIGGTFVFLPLYGVNQAQIQRLLTVRTLNESRRALWLSFPILLFLSCSTGFAGLIMYSKYKDCDPILQGRIHARDQLLPFYVIETMSQFPGVTGLFIAGILSGSLSTISSAINSLTAVTWRDYLLPFMKDSSAEVHGAFFNKLIAFFYGLLTIGLAFVAAQFSGILQASLIVFGIIGGPLLGLFTLGMSCPFVSQNAAIPGFVISLIFGGWIGFGEPKPPVTPLSLSTDGCPRRNGSEFMFSSFQAEPKVNYFYMYRISYMWYSLIGFSITMLIGVILSFKFPQKSRVSRKLLFPVLSRILDSECIEEKPKDMSALTFTTSC